MWYDFCEWRRRASVQRRTAPVFWRPRGREEHMVTNEPALLTERATAGERLLLVTNRGPVTYDVTRDGRLRPTRGSGGVVTALEAVRGQRPVRWIACAMTDGDRRAAAEGLTESDGAFSQGFVVLPRDVYRKYYEVFANRVIWFLQHYLWNAPYEPKIDTRMWDAWESGYVPANAAFADAVVAELERGVTNFLATVYDNLPDVEVDAAASALRYRGREIAVRAYPISVDPARLRRVVRSAEARRHVARLAARAGERTIVRVDRMDPSKNIVRGFEAFDRLLRRRPEFRGRVRFLAFLVPTREKVPAYRRY